MPLTQGVTIETGTDKRIVSYEIPEFLPMAKALASDVRLRILELLSERSLTMSELANQLGLPASTTVLNVKKLTDVGLVVTTLVPGSHGTQRVCALVASRVMLDLGAPHRDPDLKQIHVSMPVGHYVDCEVYPTCGLVSEHGIIGELDDPRSFFEPDRVNAQLLWFRRGYVEYRFPQRVPPGQEPVALELAMEACSEAPLHNPDWPSDITLWINGREIGTWTSPGDFGGQPGYLTPRWWGTQNTQYGLLKTWRVTPRGSYLDGLRLSDVRLEDLALTRSPFITVRIGVKEGAENEGGINLFGRRFGNYEMDLELRIDYARRETKPGDAEEPRG